MSINSDVMSRVDQRNTHYSSLITHHSSLETAGSLNSFKLTTAHKLIDLRE
jgi:hypothetical protein